MSTVNENTKFLSDSQQVKAKEARKMMQGLGVPTVADLKAIVRMDLIKDVKANAEDANLAERVRGPDLGNLKGKSARSKPTPATSNITELTEELLNIQEDVALSIGGMRANDLKLLTTVSHDVHCRTTQVFGKNQNLKSSLNN